MPYEGKEVKMNRKENSSVVEIWEEGMKVEITKPCLRYGIQQSSSLRWSAPSYNKPEAVEVMVRLLSNARLIAKELDAKALARAEKEAKKAALEAMPKRFKTEDILCGYSGKPGCRCGCLGKYYYTQASAEEAGKRRGYPVSEDEISPRMIKKISNIINQNWDKVEVVDDKPESEVILDYLDESGSRDGRYYTLYLKPGSKLNI